VTPDGVAGVVEFGRRRRCGRKRSMCYRLNQLGPAFHKKKRREARSWEMKKERGSNLGGESDRRTFRDSRGGRVEPQGARKWEKYRVTTVPLLSCTTGRAHIVKIEAIGGLGAKQGWGEKPSALARRFRPIVGKAETSGTDKGEAPGRGKHGRASCLSLTPGWRGVERPSGG